MLSVSFGTPSGVYAYRQKAIRRSAAALRSGLDPVATERSTGPFCFTLRPVRVRTPNVIYTEIKTTARWTVVFVWYTIRGFRVHAFGKSAVLRRLSQAAWTHACSRVHRTLPRRRGPFGFSPLMLGISKNKTTALWTVILFWYTIRGSNPGHPAHRLRFYIVLYGVIRCYIVPTYNK